MRLRWNPDGNGRRAVPAEYLALAKKKRAEFLLNAAASACIGIGLSFGHAWCVGQASSALFGETLVWMAGGGALGIGVSALS